MSGAGLHVFGGEVWIFSGDVVEVVFGVFLPGGLYVVERDLDGAVFNFCRSSLCVGRGGEYLADLRNFSDISDMAFWTASRLV